MPLRSGFSDLLKTGLLVGLVSGFVLGILVCVWNLPLILEAEKFESKSKSKSISISENSNTGKTHIHSNGHGETHSHAKAQTNTSDEIVSGGLFQKRNLGTIVGSTLLGISFGVLLSIWIAFFPLNGFFESLSLSKAIILSILFTIGGFLIFFGIPFLGLPPELPGRASGAYDYPERQAWWYLCVGSSLAGALGSQTILSYLKIRNLLKWTLAIVTALFFVGFPFYLGVPKISEDFAAPKELRIQFEYTTLLTNLIFWFLLSSLFFLLWKPKQVLGFK
ncbi:CbtA family protein [Leptospira johnsonii]|uniref:Putative cobalt transporter subunit CbtA n=1 Tax=Leptospira johnsonii TaxID=1917820 RepID=A0A2P2CY76_9LEPT|nr:CbtA family protein [Leptospira johnsonii]GBF37285.1 putative cobalt transporter subunit CbtA [Leptospira johnsonii]